MRPSRIVVWLSGLIAALAAVSSGASLLPGAGAPFAFTTVRGETVQMYGQGLYRYEVMRNGIGFKGADMFVLLVAIPLLIAATASYRRGSLRGSLLLTGTLAYFLYNGAQLVFAYAYNSLFLLYIALFGASLFATILAYRSVEPQTLATRTAKRLPRRPIAGFLFVVGGSLVIVWVGLSIVPALLQGAAPELAGATTLITHALDVGVIAPTAVIAGVLLLRRVPEGVLLSGALLTMAAILGGAVLALSAAQIAAGALRPAETLAFVAPFVVLTAGALWMALWLLRSVEAPTGQATPPLRGARA